jgi:hypothetical protein
MYSFILVRLLYSFLIFFLQLYIVRVSVQFFFHREEGDTSLLRILFYDE